MANFEGERSTPYERTLRDIRTALSTAGVEFINDDRGEGVVKLRS